MKPKKKNDDTKSLNKGNPSEKSKKGSTKHDEDFNTGSHSPSSLRKVGPGYDDTGMGNGSQAPGSAKYCSSFTKKAERKHTKNTKDYKERIKVPLIGGQIS